MEQDQLLWQASNKYHLHIVFPTIPQKKSNSDFAHQEYNQKESENRSTYSKKLKKRFLGTTYRPPPIQKSNNQKNHIKTTQILIFERNLPLENFSHHTTSINMMSILWILKDSDLLQTPWVYFSRNHRSGKFYPPKNFSGNSSGR